MRGDGKTTTAMVQELYSSTTVIHLKACSETIRRRAREFSAQVAQL
jgi:hypothetical protein